MVMWNIIRHYLVHSWLNYYIIIAVSIPWLIAFSLGISAIVHGKWSCSTFYTLSNSKHLGIFEECTHRSSHFVCQNQRHKLMTKCHFLVTTMWGIFGHFKFRDYSEQGFTKIQGVHLLICQSLKKKFHSHGLTRTCFPEMYWVLPC